MKMKIILFTQSIEIIEKNVFLVAFMNVKSEIIIIKNHIFYVFGCRYQQINISHELS